MEQSTPFGCTSAERNSGEGVVLFTGGDRSHGVAVVLADLRFRLNRLARAEVALSDDLGRSVTLTSARIGVTGGGRPVHFTNGNKARCKMPTQSPD
ncbi:phage baseplate assembly protein, partial [Salmonella enterica]|uniref:phage baseplate assembly protein domain-containing protein n=1 Tax=Salmonella enterica TaxID=28901 RepID=UPI00398C4A5B